MRKLLLGLSVVFLLASFTKINNEIVLKDIDGTLLQSYAVVDQELNTVTFTVDANTTVSSSVIDGEFRVFLVENGTSNESATYTLNVEGNGNLSFDNYFESTFDVASASFQVSALLLKKQKPKLMVN